MIARPLFNGERYRMEGYYAPPPGCERPNMSSVYQDLAVVARRSVIAIRTRAFEADPKRGGFRPFHHDGFLASPAVQRFVPGPTWSYVPPRDRPRHPTTGCVCRASDVAGMLHIQHCSARWEGEPWRVER